MMILSAFLLAVSAPGPSPEREILDALKASCDRAGAIEAMKADATAAGWEAIADGADPRIAKLLKLGRDAIGTDGKMTGATYRRTIGGRELFLILSRYEDESGFWGAGCRLYDFAATAPLDPAMLEAWMGKPPTGVEDLGAGLGRRLWEPGWRDGITLEASHVPRDHPMGQSFGLEGNILVAQAIGGF